MLFIAVLLAIHFLAYQISNADSQLVKRPRDLSKYHNWPSFRGYMGSGIAFNQNLPLHWDGKSGKNIIWKTAIPGLGHSSPVVWQDKVFITTAVGEKGDPRLKVGLYGSSPKNPEKFIHHFKVYCLSVKTGKIIWEKNGKHFSSRIL